MPEELNSDNQTDSQEENLGESQEKDDISEEGTDAGESSEETSSQDTQQYNKERFDGLMSKWQSDRRELTKLQKEKEQWQGQQKPQQEASDDMLVDHFRTKIREKDEADKKKQDAEVNRQLDELRVEYPDFKREDILKTAIDYSDDEKPISLRTACKFLKAQQEGQKTKQAIDEENQQRKANTGAIAGRSGVQTEQKIKTYDPEKDKDKTIDDLVDEGKKELGIN